MKSSIFLLSATMAIAAGCSDSVGLQERLDSYFETRYGDTDATPGAAIVIMKGDSILYESYRGLANLETGEKIDSTTTFCIASVSKQFTVSGLLQLAAQGKVDIDSPMAEYFPEYESDIWQKVTPRHLASQSSGIPDLRNRSDRQKTIYATDSMSVEFFEWLDTLLFVPGEFYDYQNPTFLMLAKITERVSGMPFLEYQQENIFNKAGMVSTYYFNPEKTPAVQSHAYQPTENGWEEFDYGEETFFATRPDGGIYSTARDMARWESALRKNEILPAEWLAKAYTPIADVGNSPFCDYQRREATWYGLGWFIENREGKPLKVFHTGDNGGYQAYVGKYPESGVSVIVLENRHDLDRWTMVEDVERILVEEGIV